MRIAMVAAELNDVQTMVGDLSSAFEAYTKEKVCISAGPEFGALQGHILIIERALYGLHTAGARWHDWFSHTLQIMGVTPCKAYPDVWLKDCDTHYEFVCVYVADLSMVMSKDPQTLFDAITQK
jgi:hypothetical protein